MYTSVQHFISHVKCCSNAKELIFTLKNSYLSIQLNGNMNKLEGIPVSMVNASRL